MPYPLDMDSLVGGESVTESTYSSTQATPSSATGLQMNSLLK